MTEQPLIASADGKLNMEDSRLGSYVGGKRGFAVFMLVWHASWLVDWNDFHGTSLFFWYMKSVDFIHPFPLGLNLENIAFKGYATVYFYIVSGVAPLFSVFCMFAARQHFHMVAPDVMRIRWFALISNIFLFTAMITGLFYLAYFDAQGFPVPRIAAESKYYYIGFGLILCWGIGLAFFVVCYIVQMLVLALKRKSRRE